MSESFFWGICNCYCGCQEAIGPSDKPIRYAECGPCADGQCANRFDKRQDEINLLAKEHLEERNRKQYHSNKD
jgi:hypothetical protein